MFTPDDGRYWFSIHEHVDGTVDYEFHDGACRVEWGKAENMRHMSLLYDGFVTRRREVNA